MGSLPKKFLRFSDFTIEKMSKNSKPPLEKMAGWILPPQPENPTKIYSWVGAASLRDPWNYKRRKHAARHPKSLATLAVEKQTSISPSQKFPGNKKNSPIVAHQNDTSPLIATMKKI